MLKYRPEIDGLRTIAVLSVVLYHADIIFYNLNPFFLKQYGINFFEGGFIGVDIFFVISGYLISLIILTEMSNNNFSFVSFYERRARRILPALFFVMIAAIPFAITIMQPKELIQFSGSILSALNFSSNFWFWLEDSYTAGPSALKPFLHTWSLSIEEQFYLFFPIMILVIWRYFKKYLMSILIIIFLVSLQLADFWSSLYRDTTFYLLHTRGWELIAGSLLAKIEIDYGRKNNSILGFIMPSIGLFLVVHSIIFFDDQMRHPSFITLIPILGTMLLIWFSQKGEIVTDILSSKIFVSIGLISYSLYLWHFPIFAFSRILEFDPSITNKLIQISLSFILAIISYKFIEKPFRKKGLLSLKTIILLLGSTYLVLMILTGSLYYVNSTKMSNFQIGDKLFDIDEEKNKRFIWLHSNCPEIGWAECRKPQQNKKNILVVGDSMSIDAVNILSPIFPEYHYIVDDEFGGCPPHPDIKTLVPDQHPNLLECIKKNESRFKSASLLDKDLIIINLLYSWFEPEDLIPYLQFLKKNNFSNVLIFGNYISLKKDFYETFMEGNINFDNNNLLDDHNDLINTKFYKQKDLSVLSNKFGYSFINVEKYACNDKCPLFINSYPYTWDKFHYSLEFSQFLSKKMSEDLKKIFVRYRL
tara:strand:+ start:673 stop:2607 length:1935 start_codon:yes stop_codon:yes gene_type:complete